MTFFSGEIMHSLPPLSITAPEKNVDSMAVQSAPEDAHKENTPWTQAVESMAV